MTDYEYTDQLAITLILWDRDRRDEVYVTMHLVFVDGQPSLRTYDTHNVADEFGEVVTELPFAPKAVDVFIASLRAHTYAQRRETTWPRPQDHQHRVGRRDGPCAECLASGWIVTPDPIGRRRRPNGDWTTPTLRWLPCPRCDRPDQQAA